MRHELRKACILDTGHAFSTFEVGRGRIPAFLPLACIIDEELRHLAERAAFLAVVDNNAQSARLGTARAFLTALDSIRPAGAHVGAQDVGTRSLIMHAAGAATPRVRKL